MSEENKKIGLRIRTVREKQKLSREKLAELSNISTQFLADIETGKKGMTVNTLMKICNSLCVTSDYIIYGKDSSLYIDIEPIIAKLDEDKQTELGEIIQKIVRLIKGE